MKKQTSIRLSPEAQELIRKLVQKLGISQSDVLELAIRRLAEQEHVREPA
jgi:Arc/MetJ-type ribon-helix-helix transcriptional regulator